MSVSRQGVVQFLKHSERTELSNTSQAVDTHPRLQRIIIVEEQMRLDDETTATHATAHTPEQSWLSTFAEDNPKVSNFRLRGSSYCQLSVLIKAPL